MPPRALDARIDDLYQLPFDEFTAARNALAKEAGPDAARVRALAKPQLAAWAVNQLFWHERGVWDELVAAAEQTRHATKAVLSGRSGDVRAAGDVHEAAVGKALKATLALLTDAGHPATDATRQAIVNTLRAVPAHAQPGRLTHALTPGGFEMLAGLSSGPRAGASRPRSQIAPPRAAKPGAREGRHRASPPGIDRQAVARARAALAAAERDVRGAEHAVRREEFETARAAREDKRANDAIEEARAALKRAHADLEEAEAAAKTVAREHEAAERRAREARDVLAAAKKRHEQAAGDLKKVERG